jgi:replicative DNA helicase
VQTSLLNSLLSADFYEQNKSRLKETLFDDRCSEVFKLIAEAHSKYSHDLTVSDILALWKAKHPAATNTDRTQFTDLVAAVADADPLSPDIASDVIDNLWKQETGREIANLGISISEGRYEAMDMLKRLLDKVGEHYVSDDFGEPVTDDIYTLLAEASDDARWKFNIETLSRNVYGIGPSEFGIVFARPETGKTAFVVSLAAAPNGFCQQGAKVLYLGNEEAARRTKLRAVQAWAGLTKAEVHDNPDLAMTRYLAIRDRLVMKDIQEKDLAWVDAYIGHIKPDVVIIDQLDKVNLTGSFNASHERLRELYRQAREMAKRHEVALIGLSQASADAEGRTRLDFSMMEGSKTGKAAEADLIIGIGKHSSQDDDEPNSTRFLNVSKNKLSGYHGVIACNIEPEISRYVV